MSRVRTVHRQLAQSTRNFFVKAQPQRHAPHQDPVRVSGSTEASDGSGLERPTPPVQLPGPVLIPEERNDSGVDVSRHVADTISGASPVGSLSSIRRGAINMKRQHQARCCCWRPGDMARPIEQCIGRAPSVHSMAGVICNTDAEFIELDKDCLTTLEERYTREYQDYDGAPHNTPWANQGADVCSGHDYGPAFHHWSLSYFDQAMVVADLEDAAERLVQSEECTPGWRRPNQLLRPGWSSEHITERYQPYHGMSPSYPSSSTEFYDEDEDISTLDLGSAASSESLFSLPGPFSDDCEPDYPAWPVIVHRRNPWPAGVSN